MAKGHSKKRCDRDSSTAALQSTQLKSCNVMFFLLNNSHVLILSFRAKRKPCVCLGMNMLRAIYILGEWLGDHLDACMLMPVCFLYCKFVGVPDVNPLIWVSIYIDFTQNFLELQHLYMCLLGERQMKEAVQGSLGIALSKHYLFFLCKWKHFWKLLGGNLIAPQVFP